MGGLVMATEFVRRAVVETRMRPHVIVMASPDFDEYSSVSAAAEPLHAQAFIPELAVEALVGSVLPGLAGIDQRGVDLRFSEPFQNRFAHELRAVVGAPEQRRAARADQTREYVDDAAERILPATSIARHLRVNSLITVRHLSLCPLAQAS